jgi:[acyl-carrier-protein] S-malonyltransferase
MELEHGDCTSIRRRGSSRGYKLQPHKIRRFAQIAAGRAPAVIIPSLENLTAFLFPGQGSQFPGMGKALADAHAAARRVFEEADDALSFPISRLCFEGPEEQLKLTENTQPALLTVSTAAHAVLRENGVTPIFVAGHSLGEYSALVAAGCLKFADAVRLVRNRGRYMQEAVPAGVGAMAAILKLPEGKLDAILAEAAQGEIVSAANLNSPEQVVIAGHAGAVGRAMELAKAAGARRAILLPVSAPFHCALMKPAQERLLGDLNQTGFQDLECPLVNNWQAAAIQTGAEARTGLYEQVPNPVRWVETVQYLASHGVTRCIEIGAGGVLTGLLRGIAPTVSGLKFGEPGELGNILT